MVKWLLQDKQSPTPNSALLRPSPGPGMGHPLGHRPAQVTKIRRSHRCGLRLVAENIVQHPSPRVWGDFQKEPLNVKMFPSDPPDLSSSQHIPAHPNRTPGLSQSGATSPPSTFLHPPGWEALGPALGTETKVLTFRSAPPEEVCVVLLEDGGPSDPEQRQHLKSQAQLPSLCPVSPTHTEGSRKVTVPPDGGTCAWGCKLKKYPPPPETQVNSIDPQPHLAARANLGPQAPALL